MGENEGWIEKLKAGGAVPLGTPESCSNGWASPEGTNFMVRGKDYMTTRKKIPAGEYILKPIGFDWMRNGANKISQILENPNSRIRKVIDSEFPNGDHPFIWAFNLQLPTKENFSAAAYFASEDECPNSLVEQFLKGDDAFRNSKLKLIANIVKGPWIVRKAVGEQAVCLIGRALTCSYYRSGRFVEIDIDIGSSMVASAIVHLAFSYISTLTVDIGFVIEGVTEDELPEEILGAFRFADLDPSSALPYDLHESNFPVSSLPTRLWKSIGMGFSQLLQHPDEKLAEEDNDRI